MRTSHRHELLFFADDKTLLDSFTLFIATTLRAGNAAILLFTKSHQEMLHQRLKAEHIDVDGAIRRGSFISLDFDDAKFMADDSPDPIQYHENFRSLIDAAYKAATAEHPRVVAVKAPVTCARKAKQQRLSGSNKSAVL